MLSIAGSKNVLSPYLFSCIVGHFCIEQIKQGAKAKGFQVLLIKEVEPF